MPCQKKPTKATAARQVGFLTTRPSRRSPATSQASSLPANDTSRAAAARGASTREVGLPDSTLPAGPPCSQGQQSELMGHFMPMPLPGSDTTTINMLAAGSAAATDGPSTADVAAEVIRQLRSQGLVMRGAGQQLATQVPCPSEQAIPPASAQPAISRVVAQLTGEERHTVSSIYQPLDLHVDTTIKAQIQANEFIEFNTLTISPAPIHQPEQYSLQITGNNLQVVPKQKNIPYPHPRAMDICIPHLRHDIHPSPPVFHLRTNEICLDN